MSFVEKSISIFLTRIAVIIVTFAAGVISTRILGPAKKGVLDILFLLPFFAVNFGHLGIGNANLFYVAKKRKPLDKIVSNSISIATLLGIFLTGGCYIAFFVLRESIFTGISFEMTLLVFVIIPFALFQKYSMYTLMGREEISSRNRIIFYPVLMRLTSIILLMVFLKMELLGVILADLASYLMSGVLCLYFIAKWTKIRWRFDFKLFIDSVKFGFIPFIALLVMNLNYRADLFFVKYYIDNTAVGLYSLAVSLADTLGLLPEAIAAVLFARVANVSNEEASEITSKVCRFSLFICTVGGIVFWGFADFVVTFIYGENFAGSVWPLKILIPGIVFMQLFVLLHSDLTGRGKAKITVYIFSSALVINLILNWLWIPRFGINGAAAASSVSYTAGSLFLAWIFSRIMRIDFHRILFVTKSDFENILAVISNRINTMRGG